MRCDEINMCLFEVGAHGHAQDASRSDRLDSARPGGSDGYQRSKYDGLRGRETLGLTRQIRTQTEGFCITRSQQVELACMRAPSSLCERMSAVWQRLFATEKSGQGGEGNRRMNGKRNAHTAALRMQTNGWDWTGRLALSAYPPQ